MRRALQITLLAATIGAPLAPVHAQPAAAPAPAVDDRPSTLDIVVAGGVVGGTIGKIYATGFAATVSSIGSGISSGVSAIAGNISGAAVAATTASTPVIAGVVIGGAAAYLVYRQIR